MNRMNVNCAINNLSFGNVSVNILYEMFKRGMKINLFPIGNIDMTAYDWISSDFISWLQSSIAGNIERLDPADKTLKIWHFNGSEATMPNQTLFTFHELDSATTAEINIAKVQKRLFLSSSFSHDIFSQHLTCGYAKLGFDSCSFKNTNKEYTKNKIVFGLIGKWEKRKNTEKIISTWLSEYGNKPEFHLYCLVDNPFFQKDQMNMLKARVTGGKTWTNLTFLERMVKNSEVNELLNAINIDLGGLSSGEGWNLPSFNATALGKWSIVINAHAHKDWATNDNSVLVESTIKEPCFDGVFFKDGGSYNQGQYFQVSPEQIREGMIRAVSAYKTVGINSCGKELQKQTYSQTLDTLLL